MLIAALLLTACGEEDDTGDATDCDTMAAVSVSVNLTSATGGPLDDAQVQYTAEGGSPTACDYMSDTWLCGYEVAGDILIEASATCHQDAAETVTIEQGECHVVGQDLQMVLDYEDCTGTENPSVFVTVADEAGTAITDAEVGYVPADKDWTDFEDCEVTKGGWNCGTEIDGVISIQVYHEDYKLWFGQVEVGADCCNVITETLDVTLETPE